MTTDEKPRKSAPAPKPPVEKEPEAPTAAPAPAAAPAPLAPVAVAVFDTLTPAVRESVLSVFVRQEPQWISIPAKINTLCAAMRDACDGDIGMEAPRTRLALAALPGLLETSRGEINDRYTRAVARAFHLADLCLN